MTTNTYYFLLYHYKHMPWATSQKLVERYSLICMHLRCHCLFCSFTQITDKNQTPHRYEIGKKCDSHFRDRHEFDMKLQNSTEFEMLMTDIWFSILIASTKDSKLHVLCAKNPFRDDNNPLSYQNHVRTKLKNRNSLVHNSCGFYLKLTGW